MDAAVLQPLICDLVCNRAPEFSGGCVPDTRTTEVSCWFVPSAFMVQMLSIPATLSAWNEIFDPSGDHVGTVALRFIDVSCLTLLPLAFITKIS